MKISGRLRLVLALGWGFARMGNQSRLKAVLLMGLLIIAMAGMATAQTWQQQALSGVAGRINASAVL
jgi:hypothetical protein